jgi:magnesium transporter
MGGDGIQKLAGVESQQHHGVTWVDVRHANSEVLAQLEREYHLHPVHLTESVQNVQHTEVERENDYLFLVLHFPVFEPHTDKISAGQMGVFLGHDYLITIHAESSPFINDLYMTCTRSSEQAELYFAKGSARLLQTLIVRMLGSIAGMTDLIESELDGIEGLVFENTTSDAQRIGRLRQKIIRLRRLIGPKRALLEDLTAQIESFAGAGLVKYYSSTVKMVNRLWEAIEEAKETIEIYKDADFTTSTERTNRTLAILTLVFTFTIPITVAGTLYGMNVPLPGGLVTGPWHFFGQYTTFMVLLALSLGMATGMYIYFRKKKWF